MTTQDIRRKFLDYFKKKQHAVIASSPVVPHDDPSLLFINAGMNQFKDVFLGKSIREYDTAVTCQKCIRVGGKHNDLENVGHTSRHLTFFEMLGNFSFGAYFKEKAIDYAWEISTGIFGFEPEKLWPTVFRDDEEAFEMWKKYVPTNRITRLGEKDNFWAMGETGPCGPCSEILYDRGQSYGNATSPLEDLSGERYLEFWNLVFMQFNKDCSGIMHPLPKPSIDTGAGLERVMSLKMGVNSVFATDIFKALIAEIENVGMIKYQSDSPLAPAFHVISDHLRSLSFAIADGVQPSNVDRGYVLRKILRRAVRYGKMLGFEAPFLAKLLPRLIATMGEDYQELKTSEQRIAELLTTEEENFFRTLKRGGNILNQIIASSTKSAQISGEDAFKLKDTYGLPFEEIVLLAKDSSLGVDFNRYEELEKEAKERSRSVRKTTQQVAGENFYAQFVQSHGPTSFVGYTQFEVESKVIGILLNDQPVDVLNEGEEGIILLDKTPFYAEKGGQVADNGTINGANGLFAVADCQTPFPGVVIHQGKMTQGSIRQSSVVLAGVNLARRQIIANNHTATHLLHWALHQILGEHIRQAGSVVDEERLRFDFSHHKALSADELRAIESLVNQKIRENQPVQVYEISYEDVQHRKDIKQFFGEKYGSKVRVIDIDYSKELCGGTHTNAVGSIGFFRIVKESSISTGVRRIEAVTGQAAEKLVREIEDQLTQLAQTLKVQREQIFDKVTRLVVENKKLQHDLENFRKNALQVEIEVLLGRLTMVHNVSVLCEEVDFDPATLKELAEMIIKIHPSIVLVLASKAGERCALIARVSPDLIQKGIKANELIKQLGPIIDGSGGGKADFAQAGGKNINAITAALEKARQLIEELCNPNHS